MLLQLIIFVEVTRQLIESVKQATFLTTRTPAGSESSCRGWRVMASDGRSCVKSTEIKNASNNDSIHFRLAFVL